MQEVPVIERLQTEVTELEVARSVQSGAEPLQVEIGQALIEELGTDTSRDELWKILGVSSFHLRLQGLFAQNLPPDGMKKQPGGDVAVGRILFDQCARRKHRGLAHLVGRHPVIDILQGFGNNQLGIHHLAQTLASRRYQFLESSQIERAPHAVLDGMKLRLGCRFLLRRFVGARLGALFPV